LRDHPTPHFYGLSKKAAVRTSPCGTRRIIEAVLVCVTADFRSAGFELLEQLMTVPTGVPARLIAARHELSGAVVLATCNRFEAYLDVAPGAVDVAVADLIDAVATESGVAVDRLESVLSVRSSEDVPAHLFAVASGLESLVVGEGEIAGQVSRSLESARAAGTTTTDLERLFQRAARASSGVKNRTRLSTAGRSVVRLALELAESRIPAWSGVHVLLIGTGQYAGATLAALRDRGVGTVHVYSPSNRAERFARREGVVAVPAGGLDAALAEADLVIACSVAPVPLVGAADLTRAIATRPGRRMIIDLGLPRNVAPDAVGVPDVELLDLETIGVHAPLPELRATDEAMALIGAAVDEFKAAASADAVTPAIIAFRTHVLDLVEGEIERLRSRGETSEATERAMRHVASVLVHGPTVRAKELAAEGSADVFAAAVETVFGVHPQARVVPLPTERSDRAAG
jgi:glutamyl-tRNA reductase